ncbi:glucose dehydrogenase [Salinicola sp. MH3R3-1]|uniref:PQQ-dependent sugar dehydrogenase n=1 Tax=Salinicola sp. MH3R3-1 TaxID=1928762 RepID=UPI00094E9691|nr:PQQ-dependent sugar dehydrogenase [Salinicola sp. MH3R3-1]OLO09135.1 glucose dehydrogenase [Salinicola sp. MH3R3-1]
MLRNLLTSSSAALLLSLSGESFAQAPVQSGLPNAPDQTPAFDGQTRAPALEDDIDLSMKTIAKGLEHPWGLAFVDNDMALVTERAGRLRAVDLQAGTLSPPIEGLPEIDTRGQGGLFDVSLDPDFASNRRIYFSYAEPRGDGENGTSVARGVLSQDHSRLTDVEVIFRQTPAWDSTKHFGSALAWDDQGRLYVTLGERSLPEPRQLAQDLDTHLGKVVRIDADGSIPDDNPFADGHNAGTERDGLAEIWSYGHRNVQGAAWESNSGKLWTIEHGPKGGDELNVPQAGKNYGWPVITYGEDYSGAPIGDGLTAKEGMEQPIYYWDPVIAPGDMTFYRGERFPDWQDNLIIASLSPGGLVRLTLDGERVTGEQRLASSLGRVRDVAESADGALWVLTDSRDGALIRITPENE